MYINPKIRKSNMMIYDGDKINLIMTDTIQPHRFFFGALFFTSFSLSVQNVWIEHYINI